PSAEDQDRAVRHLTAGYRWEDRHLVAVGDRRVEAVLEADVLTGHVNIDEAAQVAVLSDPLPQPVVLVEDRVACLPDRGALDLDLALAAGRGSQLRGDLHGYRHRL